MKKIVLSVLGFYGAVVFGSTLELIKKIPHSGYSEGLEYRDGFLWNSSPKKITKIDPADGSVLESYLPATEHSESLTFYEGQLWNLSFSDNGIYAGKVDVAKKRIEYTRKGSTPEEHGWGFAYDGKQFIVTGNYSDKIYFLDPKSLKVTRKITVPVSDLEDVAWDGTGIWTSSFRSHRGEIFRVDPKTGAVVNFFKLPDDACPVIDGLAWDGKTLWITGKECTSIYQVKKPSEKDISEKRAVTGQK